MRSHLKSDGRGELLPHYNVPTALHRSVHLHLKQKKWRKKRRQQGNNVGSEHCSLVITWIVMVTVAATAMVTVWNHLDIASNARGGKIAKVCSHDIHRFKMPNLNLIACDTGVIVFGKCFRMLKFNFVSCELWSLPRPKTQLLISNIQDRWFKAKIHDRVFVLPKNSWQNFRLIC